MSLAAFERKIIQLEAEMAAAVEREDYETAARLRDEIASLKGGGAVRKPPPGEMGLGTNVPVVKPPTGWVKPKKPDLMTNVKPRKR
jgi:ATP-dependent Clp protease ATP-binding subunit ClpA